MPFSGALGQSAVVALDVVLYLQQEPSNPLERPHHALHRTALSARMAKPDLILKIDVARGVGRGTDHFEANFVNPNFDAVLTFDLLPNSTGLKKEQNLFQLKPQSGIAGNEVG